MHGVRTSSPRDSLPWTVSAYERERPLEIAGSEKSYEMRESIALKSTNGGTRASITMGFEPTVRWARIIAPLVSPLRGIGAVTTRRVRRSYAVRLSVGTTSLFTDIAGSSELVVRIGDSAWAELLERHNAAVRAQLDAFAGREMDAAGDGFFAIFADVAGALSAAAAIQEAVRPLGLAVRLGLHIGDCYVVDDKCTGLAIHICARIVALAEPGEVLVSQAVRDAAGSGFHFVGRGTHELRGIPGEWVLSALVHRS